MNRSRFLLAPVLALFDFKLYKEVRALGTGSGFLYLTYLAGIFSVFFLIAGIINIPKADAFVEWLQKDFKGMTVSRDGMKLDQPGRFELRHPQLGALAAFDDTRENINPGEMGDYLVYMTSKMIYVKRGGAVQSSSIGARAKKDFTQRIDASMIRQIYQRLKLPFFIFLSLVIFIFGFISRLVTAVVFAALGYLIQLFLPRGLRFENFFVLASFALSVGLIFGVLQMIPGAALFFSGPVAAVLAFVYFVIAIVVQPKVASPSR